MPSEALQRPTVRLPARTVQTAAPPRLRPKGPVGPDFYRRLPTSSTTTAASTAGRPRQSAVERLEADKAKYVKSQVALSKQEPIRPPDVRRPLLTPSSALRPTRKTQTPTKTKQEGVQLDLEHLSNLISGVMCDGPQSTVTVNSESTIKVSDCTVVSTPQKKERPCPPPRPDWSSPAKVRLKQASGPNRTENTGSTGSPATVGTVRRVDVIPQVGPIRTPSRPPPQFIRQPLQPIPLQTQSQLHQATSNLRLFHLRTTTTPAPLCPLKPVIAQSNPNSNPSSPSETPVPASPSTNLLLIPPASPAVTRLSSSSSSRKRRSLTRSKSDMSDRYSRAGTELERFFNLCGLDPSDLQDWTGSSSDIVSMARFRSVSAPGSECGGSGKEENGEEEEEEEDAANAAGRVSYGVSVIERNARVIKWLYGLRHAKDSVNKSTNL